MLKTELNSYLFLESKEGLEALEWLGTQRVHLFLLVNGETGTDLKRVSGCTSLDLADGDKQREVAAAILFTLGLLQAYTPACDLLVRLESKTFICLNQVKWDAEGRCRTGNAPDVPALAVVVAEVTDSPETKKHLRGAALGEIAKVVFRPSTPSPLEA